MREWVIVIRLFIRTWPMVALNNYIFKYTDATGNIFIMTDILQSVEGINK